MSRACADQIEVQVVPDFCDEESDVDESRFVFKYTINVHNHSGQNMQLLARHWKITQSSGEVHEVRGKGVVGQQPMIAPGQAFSYTSRAIIDGPVGVMEGSFTCVDTASQKPFEVAVTAFRLAAPNQVH